MRHAIHDQYIDVTSDNVLDLLNANDANQQVAALTVIHICEWRWCTDAVMSIAEDDGVEEEVAMYAELVLSVLMQGRLQ